MKGTSADMNCYLCKRRLVKMIEGPKRWLLVSADMHETRVYCPECFEKDHGKPDWKKIADRYRKPR
jgi:hypothetical protein